MSTTEALAAINKTVMVQASVENAFETFTRGIGSWWPTESHRLFDESSVIFEEREGGRVYERSADGEEGDWADVIAWEPPRHFLLRWRVNPNRGPTELDVRFTAEGDGTRIDLEHRGWDDPEGRANYQTGWDPVFAAYAHALDRT